LSDIKGVENMETYNLTEAKAKLSSIISRVTFAGETVMIRRKGKNVAVVVSYEDYLKKWAETGENEGLLLAKGALSDIEDFDQFIESIYEARESSTDRNVAEV
jgi:prevent-host-death family protein